MLRQTTMHCEHCGMETEAIEVKETHEGRTFAAIFCLLHYGGGTYEPAWEDWRIAGTPEWRVARDEMRKRIRRNKRAGELGRRAALADNKLNRG